MNRILALALLSLVGCSAKESSQNDEKDPCADGGAYVRVNVTDEACHVFVDEETRGNVVVDPYKGPVWSAPAAGAQLSRATLPTFSWTKGTLASIPRWRRFFALEGVAYAHGETTGDAFIATFKDAAGNELLRVMTTELSYTPDAITWSRLAASSSIRVDLAQMRVVKNVLATGTKVTAATSSTFGVAP